MKKIWRKICQEFTVTLNKKISFLSFAATFLLVIFLRVFIEQFIAESAPIYPYEIVIEYIHNLYFFLIAFILIWFVLSWILKVNPQKIIPVFTYSSLLIVLPPLFDMFRSKGQVYWSFYVLGNINDVFRQFFTFFGALPSGIVYFGTRIVYISVIILIFILIFVKTKKIANAILGSFLSYSILFFLGCFPSFFVYANNFILGGKSPREISGFEIAAFWGYPGRIFGVSTGSINYSFPYRLDIIYYLILTFLIFSLFYLISRDKLWAVIKNARYPQLIYHSGLFLIGMGLGLEAYPQNLSIDIFSLAAIVTSIVAISLNWIASLVPNDIYDFGIDEISNPDRPLPKKIFSEKEYWSFGTIVFLLSLLGGITLGFQFFFLLLAYQVTAWIYSSEPLRLKRYPIIATLLSSAASITVLFFGFILIAENQDIHNLSWRIIILLLISYTLALPIKDFKDIEGDKKYGIFTIPVIFGNKFSRQIIGTSIFISFMLSVFFLNENKLFFWSLLFGTISYLLINSKKISPRKIFWPILGIIMLYLAILIKIIFIY